MAEEPKERERAGLRDSAFRSQYIAGAIGVFRSEGHTVFNRGARNMIILR